MPSVKYVAGKTVGAGQVDVVSALGKTEGSDDGDGLRLAGFQQIGLVESNQVRHRFLNAAE